MIDFISKDRYGFFDLVEILRLLRSPDGCPWDQVQTHQSIRRNFLEETYECCEALDTDDAALMQEELGDVLLQVLFHAAIEEDRGRFTLEDICDGECKKLVFRHPNVFGAATTQTWEDMKALEKGQKTHTQTLDAVSRSLPALWRADKLVKKSGTAGFRWPDTEHALEKLEEEVRELREAVQNGTNVFEELGDVLFAAVCAGTMAEQDPEMALHAACEKFIRRFSAMESTAATQNRSLESCSAEEQLTFWNDAKETLA